MKEIKLHAAHRKAVKYNTSPWIQFAIDPVGDNGCLAEAGPPLTDPHAVIYDL